MDASHVILCTTPQTAVSSLWTVYNQSQPQAYGTPGYKLIFKKKQPKVNFDPEIRISELGDYGNCK